MKRLNPTDLRCDKCILLSEIIKLKEFEIKRLKERIDFLTDHPTIAKGIKGETIIARLTDLSKSKSNSSFDLFSENLKFEVKYSRLSTESTTKTTKRWTWSKIFGTSGKKEFDILLLVGDSDQRFSKYYKDPLSPFIFFELTNLEATKYAKSGGSVKSMIKLSSNPLRSKHTEFFNSFQIRSDELSKKYSIFSSLTVDRAEVHAAQPQLI